MSGAALSLSEFRDLVATLQSPHFWTSDPVTRSPRSIPPSLTEYGMQFESPGARFSDAVSPEDRNAYVKVSAEGLAKPVSEINLRFCDGVVRRTLQVLVNAPELVKVTVTDAIGTHDLKLVEPLPRQTSGRFRAAGVAQVDRKARIISADAGCCSILGIDPRDPVGSYPFERVHPADLRLLSDVIAEANSNPASLAHAQLRTGSADGGWRIVEWLVMLAQEQGREPVLVINLLDMNDDVLASSRADEDELTGLLNRSGFQTELERLEVPSALAFIDLDRFKEVNDRFGHLGGDGVLKQVALRLQSAIRDHEILGRIHGDEFVVLVPSVESSTVAHRITQRLISTLDEPIEVDGQCFAITASGGYTLVLPGQPVSEVMHRADVAMYEAKRQAGSQVAPFDEELVARREMWRQATDLLPTVFERDSGLHFEFQPVLRTHNRKVLGVEALLRWRLEGGAQVPPPVALSLFESRGLVEAFTQWSVSQVADSIRAMDSWPGPRLQMGLNLSPTQLALPSLVSWLCDATAAAGIDPRRLVIEVTETEALSNNPTAHDATAILLNRGFQVSLDDFGAGWSTLDQLAATPANSLKIDRRLVATVHNPRARTVLRSLKTITDELEMAMVAEGVETTGQLQFFHELGAAAIQGWLLGRSVPLDQLQAAIVRAERIAEELLGGGVSPTSAAIDPLVSG